LKDEGSGGSTRFSRKKLPKVAIVDNDAREAEDLEVSHYYFTTGNFQAAYLRAKDAATIFPDDPAAHLALAAAAARLSKPEEAAAEYQACLKLDPTDEQLKTAKKALAELPAQTPKRAGK
jgi:Flp pilus assembly protein TadD